VQYRYWFCFADLNQADHTTLGQTDYLVFSAGFVYGCHEQAIVLGFVTFLQQGIIGSVGKTAVDRYSLTQALGGGFYQSA
jgi:hypothetical protein